MWPHTGRYVPHQNNQEPAFTYYTFTPRPLREGRLYKMDDNCIISGHTPEAWFFKRYDEIRSE